MSERLLTVLVALPLLGAAVVLFTPRQAVRAVRWLANGFMLATFALSLKLLDGDYATGQMQFVERAPWIEPFGIGWSVGVDGISLWLVLLTTLLSPVALYASWLGVRTKLKELAVAFLVLEAAMLGTFVALDAFLFYVFWELVLVPMALIIGVWGGVDRIYASVKFVLYTLVGSVLMLVALLVLAVRHRQLAGAWSFELADLQRVLLAHDEQLLCFAAFALAFAIKVPMFPLHTWLPDAHVQAPTGGSVILAAVMLKMGTYGFVRYAMPLFPWASHHVGPTIALLGVVGIVYGALCAWVQQDLKKLVAYSSVSHLGFVMLGLFSMNPTGVQGAVLQMINHGISTGALFLLVGVVYERLHTRDLGAMGGLAAPMPYYALLFVIVAMSSIGLPGTNGFIGEFMVLAGTFASEALHPWPRIFTAVAATGVVLAALYMLRAVLHTFWGPVRKEHEGVHDVTWREAATLVPLVALVFWIGLHPATFLRPMEPAVGRFVTSFQLRLQHSNARDETFLFDAPGGTEAGRETEPSGGGSVHVASAGVPGDEGRR
ncbi:MAG: NADH-quinone oxidoreductase subunit M [Myxococcota bacterium]|nr:NADH-quinone oxidoreductase subunit M [Myxococcota bacterium]MDW8362557.1 NADH-quinone oxidoreductase subunit M [Myxococcales bacterium]